MRRKQQQKKMKGIRMELCKNDNVSYMRSSSQMVERANRGEPTVG